MQGPMQTSPVKSRAQRRLTPACAAAFAVLTASFVAVGSVETAALYQSPRQSDAVHTDALKVKGGTRYVTDSEYEIHSIAMRTMLASFFVTAALGTWWQTVKRRDEKRDMVVTLHRFDRWIQGD